MMELTGEIPGLLRRTSPVRCVYGPTVGAPPADAPRAKGVVVDAPDLNGEVTICEDKSWEPMGPWAKDTVLDLSDPTGRFHARLWLLERGHDVGNEDRADVLAWSVLSVWRGGKPLRVAEQWEYWPGGGRARQYRPMRTNAAEAKAARPYPVAIGWQAGVEMGGETGPMGEAAADVSLLRQGWAVVNADGTLTLPPLPGAK